MFSIEASSPSVQPEIVQILISNESSYFSLIPKLRLQIHYTLVGTVENIQVIQVGIQILIFLCIYITASPQVSHTYFFSRGGKKKTALVQTSQNVSYLSKSIS